MKPVHHLKDTHWQITVRSDLFEHTAIDRLFLSRGVQYSSLSVSRDSQLLPNKRNVYNDTPSYVLCQCFSRSLDSGDQKLSNMLRWVRKMECFPDCHQLICLFGAFFFFLIFFCLRLLLTHFVACDIKNISLRNRYLERQTEMEL